MSEDYDGFRAHVAPVYAWGTTGLWLIRRLIIDGVRETAVAAPVEFEWTTMDEAATIDQARPTLRLPDGMARSMLDELAVHYRGTTDVRDLRRDYDHERKRVDDMLQFVMSTSRAGEVGR